MERRLPRVKRRIFAAIDRRPGISADELMNVVYADDPNGGPDSRKCVHVHIHQFNKRLAREGMTIKGHTTDGYKILRFKSVDLERPASGGPCGTALD
jgi:hypothetical protein